MIDAGTNEIKEGMLQEILFSDDSLDGGDRGGTAGKSYSLKRAVESKGLKVNLVKTKAMMSKIGQATVNHPARMTEVTFVTRKQ